MELVGEESTILESDTCGEDWVVSLVSSCLRTALSHVEAVGNRIP